MRKARVPAHQRRLERNQDAPKKVECDDKRELSAYVDFRNAVGPAAVNNQEIRDHLNEGYRNLNPRNQARLQESKLEPRQPSQCAALLNELDTNSAAGKKPTRNQRKAHARREERVEEEARQTRTGSPPRSSEGEAVKEGEV